MAIPNGLPINKLSFFYYQKLGYRLLVPANSTKNNTKLFLASWFRPNFVYVEQWRDGDWRYYSLTVNADIEQNYRQITWEELSCFLD